jgi:hypothetical protein
MYSKALSALGDKSVHNSPQLHKQHTIPTESGGADFEMRKYSLPILCLIGFISNTLAATLFLGKSLRGFSCTTHHTDRKLQIYAKNTTI